MTKKFIADNRTVLILMSLTAVGITVTGILFKQSFFRILPLYISLFVALLQSRVNRYALLIGALNSILYGIVYMGFHIYGSAMSAFCVSFPIQLATFWRWNKNKWKSTTMFRKMTAKQRIFLIAGFAVVWIGLCSILSMLGTSYILLDSTVTILGIVNYFLTMFAFVEYTVLGIVCGTANICLYISMVSTSPGQITYLIFGIYSLICTSLAFVRSRKAYALQQKQKNV